MYMWFVNETVEAVKRRKQIGLKKTQTEKYEKRSTVLCEFNALLNLQQCEF